MNLPGITTLMHSPVENYIVPGLTSWLISGEADGRGCVRMFQSDRHFFGEITPHSHRYDFSCLVVGGLVRNRVWSEDDDGDLMTVTQMQYQGIGKYGSREIEKRRYAWVETEYSTGQWYSLRSEQIHSIYFGRGAQVLFFEGPSITPHSVYLEPFDVTSGETIRTMTVAPWMFRRQPQKSSGQ